MNGDYAGRQVVGMDLHRHRSVLARMSEDGRKLGTARISNNPAALRAELARAGKNPRVVLEATYGWYWAADTVATAASMTAISAGSATVSVSLIDTLPIEFGLD
jgi:hypothetical protein